MEGPSQDLGGGESDMLCGDLGAVLASGGHKGAAGEMIGAPQETAGALMDGDDGFVAEQIGGAPRCGGLRVSPSGELEMVVEVAAHVIEREGIEVAAAHHP